MTISATPITGASAVDPMLDHLVYAAPDLEAAVSAFASATGVTPVPGGRHLGRGTRNYLVGLGPRAYLEIIGPDRENPPDPGERVPFGIDRLVAPRLVTWAVRAGGIESAVVASRNAGADHGDVRSMSRRTPDGVLLEWRLATTFPAPLDGVAPFLIDWGRTEHPASSGLPRVYLIALRATHPDPAAVTRVADALDIRLDVSTGPAGLHAVLDTPQGTVTVE